MLSFWEKNSLLKADVIIIGSGIVGLSSAAELKENYPEKNIVVLEKGCLPTGASTKNAGFACFGSLTEILADLKTMPSTDVLNLINTRWEGLQLLRQRLGDSSIGFLQKGGYELIEEHNMEVFSKIEEVNTLLYPLFGQSVFNEANYKVKEFGLGTEAVSGLIENKLEGQIDTGSMMNALWEYVSKLGVRIITGAEVGDIRDTGTKVEVDVVGHSEGGEWGSFEASKAIVCTNAFTGKLFPYLDLKPGRGQVLVTKPIENLKISGTYHIEEGFYYFRDYHNRIVLGGGRNLDFETEETTAFELNTNIQDKLTKLLEETIVPGVEVEVEHRWAGIMAFGPDKTVLCEQLSNNVLAGVRLGGMGVAIGSALGKKLATKCYD